MKKPSRSFEPENALRRLCAEPAADFGDRLLARADGPIIPFRTFLVVARDMVCASPDATATLLAALVALQMCALQRGDEHCTLVAPSRN